MARLTAAERKRLPDSAFALWGRRFPIHDKARARNALARGAQFASPSEQATIKRKVRARFPGIEVDSDKGSSHGKPRANPRDRGGSHNNSNGNGDQQTLVGSNDLRRRMKKLPRR